MNKAALVLAVAEVTGDDLPSTTRTVDAMLKVLVHTVASGEPVIIHGFGTLEPVIRPARPGRDFPTGELIQVPDKIRVRLRPAERFHDLANGDAPLPATAAELDIKLPKPAHAARVPQAAEQGAP